MKEKNKEQATKSVARSLFTVKELLLDGEQEIFYARRKDVLRLWSDINRNGIFFGEYAYIVEKRELDHDDFYRHQTRNMRYTKYLQIIEEEEHEREFLLKVPIIQVSSSNKGAYFIIDRDKVTRAVKTIDELNEMQKINETKESEETNKGFQNNTL